MAKFGNNLIILFIVVLIYKVIINIYYFFRIKHLSKMHLSWLAGESPKFQLIKTKLSLFSKKPE